MRVVFSLVLYKHKLADIRPLLDSLAAQLTPLPFDLSLHIYNSTSSYITYQQIAHVAPNLDISFVNGKNIGYGASNNLNFSVAKPGLNDLFIICNPDIYFNWATLLPLIEWIVNQNDVSCCAPLVLNDSDTIQYTAKKNPTLLSLALGRLSFLTFVPFLHKYTFFHSNKDRDYLRDCISSSYLSGCFLLVPAYYYTCVKGFSESYFLHLEDADFVRSLSSYGRTIHNPLGRVNHRWSRGSHRSFRQMLHLMRSMFIYFRKWGLVLY